MAYRVTKDNLIQVLKEFQRGYKTIVPVKEKDGIKYCELKEDSRIVLDFTNTTFPPVKDIFFNFDRDINPWEKRIVFGIRPCDVKSLMVMDEVFIKGKTKLEFYRKQREKTTLIAAVCKEYGKSCFCSYLGADPTKAPGADVLTMVDDTSVYFEPLTSKGREIFKELHLQRYRFPRIKINNFNKIKIEQMFNKEKKKSNTFSSLFWEQITDYCEKCQICSSVCPLIKPVADKNGIIKKCYIKQKLMLKLNEMHRKIQAISCVGCGRCIRSCPLNNNMKKIMEEFKDDLLNI